VRFNRRRRGIKRVHAVVDITSLLDVVFNLIIFLVVTTSFNKDEHAFVIELPSATHEVVEVTSDKTTVYVTKAGDLFLLELTDGQPVSVRPTDKLSREALLDKLRALHAKNPELPLAVRGEKDASYQHLMDVVSAIEEVGFKSVYFPYELGPR
jgi:biopolymer transport protein ExbD